MIPAPHAAFKEALPPDASDPHPPGAVLARYLHDYLQSHGFQLSDFDNWRDVGWSIDFVAEGHSLQLYFAPRGTDQGAEWLLAITPLNVPGKLRRLLGAAVPDYSNALRQAVTHAHEALSARPGLSALAWCLNGDPSTGSSVSTPAALAWPPQAHS